MKLKTLLLLLIFGFIIQPLNSSPFWGKTGHRTVGAIAETHLTGKAKRAIDKLLDNHSEAFVSTFADEIKSDEHYSKYYNWHFVNMPFDQTYQESVKNEKGDLVTGIAYCKSIIKDKNASDDDKAFYLKLLIHLVGDLHQPLHVGREEDRGGNDIKLQWQFKDTNLHSVWDSKMIDDYGMSYTELANNADDLTKKQIRTIQEGTVIDWVNESQQIAKTIYASVQEGDNLRNEYSYLHFETVRTQLQKAGIRLAKVLNDLFD
jgi:hypothetical protein